MKVFRWFAVNGMFALLAYSWVVAGNDYARTFLVVMAWLMAATSVFALSTTMIDAKIKNGDTRPIVPLWLDLLYDLSFVSVFIVGGEPVAGVAYLFHTIMLQGHYAAIERRLSGADS